MSEWVGGQIRLLFLGLRMRVAQDPRRRYRSQVLCYPCPAKRSTDVSIRWPKGLQPLGLTLSKSFRHDVNGTAFLTQRP